MVGVDLRTVQELMGHKTTAMTLRYSHLSPAHQLEAVQRLNRKPTDTATDTNPEGNKTLVGIGAEVIKFTEKQEAGARIRTADLLITNQLLYRLSYASVRWCSRS
jgi:hypothetical protein